MVNRLSIRFLILCLCNVNISYARLEILDSHASTNDKPSSNLHVETMLEKLIALNKVHLETTRELVDVMQRYFAIHGNHLSQSPYHLTLPTNSVNLSQGAKPHAIRCSSYRAVDEFIPVEQVTSNDILLEAGYDSLHGPMYFCHTLVNINGIRCRLYGKGNRRSCWVTTPSGREHRVSEKFHLLRKPEGVNIEWRRDWPKDPLARGPISELKTSAGVVYEWAVWDVYTCGLTPRFYFGRCGVTALELLAVDRPHPVTVASKRVPYVKPLVLSLEPDVVEEGLAVGSILGIYLSFKQVFRIHLNKRHSMVVNTDYGPL